MKKIIAVIGFLFAATTFAASFDCTKAGTPIEKAICSYPELSALDEQLASIYRIAATTAADQSQLKHEQRTWISQVRNKCEDANCLALTYQTRISELVGKAPNQLLPANDQMPQNQLQASLTNSAPPQNTTPPESTIQQQSPSPTESSQQTQFLVPEQQAMPDKSDTTGHSTETLQESGLTSLQIKLLGLVLLANALLTIYFHKANKLIIYRDYTDAAFTGAAPLVSIVIYFALRFFEVSPNKALVISIGIFAILMIFVVKSTARNNNGLSIFFAMALITKVTIVGLYYAIMAVLIFGSGSARKKGERYEAYEARKRREAKVNAAVIAASTAGFVSLSAWVCKHHEFSSIEEYFSPNAIASAS